jgi:hypothetical protein
VVIPFMARLFDRNLDLDRPHLDSRLRWHAGERPPLRLVELGRRILRYRSSAAIRDGTLMTQRALQAEIALARARGAKPIVLVPQYLPEDPREAAIRHDVLDSAGIRYLLVPVKPEWRAPGHNHPTPAGARAIAAAVAAAIGSARQPKKAFPSETMTRIRLSGCEVRMSCHTGTPTAAASENSDAAL